MRHPVNVPIAADRRIAMPLDLNRTPMLSLNVPERADASGLSRALTLAVPVSALLWLLAGMTVASIVR